eukprot:tig00020960_g16556.t1
MGWLARCASAVVALYIVATLPLVVREARGLRRSLAEGSTEHDTGPPPWSLHETELWNASLEHFESAASHRQLMAAAAAAKAGGPAGGPAGGAAWENKGKRKPWVLYGIAVGAFGDEDHLAKALEILEDHFARFQSPAMDHVRVLVNNARPRGRNKWFAAAQRRFQQSQFADRFVFTEREAPSSCQLGGSEPLPKPRFVVGGGSKALVLPARRDAAPKDEGGEDGDGGTKRVFRPRVLRTSSCDVAALLQEAEGRAEHVVILDDDFVPCAYAPRLMELAIDKAYAYYPQWAALYSSYDGNGIVLKNEDVPFVWQALKSRGEYDLGVDPETALMELLVPEKRTPEAEAHFGRRPHAVYRHNLFRPGRHKEHWLFLKCYQSLEFRGLQPETSFSRMKCQHDDIFPCGGHEHAPVPVRVYLPISGVGAISIQHEGRIILPPNVKPVAGKQGEDCDNVCAREGMKCDGVSFPAVSNCELLKEHFGCPAGCGFVAGYDQPCFVSPTAPKNFRPGICLTQPDRAMFSCKGWHALTSRLCPCVLDPRKQPQAPAQQAPDETKSLAGVGGAKAGPAGGPGAAGKAAGAQAGGKP